MENNEGINYAINDLESKMKTNYQYFKYFSNNYYRIKNGRVK
jgi:hypothetical protein